MAETRMTSRGTRPVVPQQGLPDQIGGLVRGLSYTPYDILGAPVDLANLALTPFGFGSQRPVMGAEWMIDKMAQAGLASPSQHTPTELLGRVLGGGFAPGAAIRGGQALSHAQDLAAAQAAAAIDTQRFDELTRLFPKGQTVPVTQYDAPGAVGGAQRVPNFGAGIASQEAARVAAGGDPYRMSLYRQGTPREPGLLPTGHSGKVKRVLTDRERITKFRLRAYNNVLEEEKAASAGRWQPVAANAEVMNEMERLIQRAGYKGYGSGETITYFDEAYLPHPTTSIAKQGRLTAKELETQINASPGGSIRPGSGDMPTEGIAVATRGNEVIVPGRATPEQIESYMASRKAELDKPGHYMGWWYDKDSNQTFLDVSQVLPDTRAGRAQAKALGEWRYQLAGFDIGAGKEIPMFTRPTWEKYQGWRAANAQQSAGAQATEFGGHQRGAVGDLTSQEGQRISTRFPTAVKRTEDPLVDNLIVDLQSARQDPKAFEHNVGLMNSYGVFGGRAPRDVQAQSERIIDHLRTNLNWLYEQVPSQIRQQAQLWYDGANRLASEAARKYNTSVESASAVYASLSPQTDWFVNVSRGDRVMDIFHTKNDAMFSPEMVAIMPAIRSKVGDKDAKEAFLRVQGKRLGDLKTPLEKAIWIRLYDEAHNSKAYNIISPDGSRGDIMKTGFDSPANMSWGSMGEISKAVSVLMDPSMSNISKQMGYAHKVRNFYNNIAAPNAAAGDVTMDTHAIAAGMLQPFSAKDAPVLHNFGGKIVGEPGPSSSSITGVQGTYPIHAEAYRRAASDQGILPRQMQSVTWEAVRGLFNKKSPQIKAAAQNIWNAYQRGHVTQSEAQDAIMELAKGIEAPAWATQ